MNRNDLVSHVAAEMSVTRVGAERMVVAVFSAIGDALARDEPVTIAGFGKFVMRSRAGRQGRNPQNRGARRDRGLEGALVQGGEGPPRRGQRIGWRDKRPGAGPSSRQCRHGTRAHSPCTRAQAHGRYTGACVRPIGETASQALRGRQVLFTASATGPTSARTRRVPRCLWQIRRRGDFCDPSRVRTLAQSRAKLRSLRARLPYTDACKHSPATALRSAALHLKSKRSLAAYGDCRTTLQPSTRRARTVIGRTPRTRHRNQPAPMASAGTA